MGKSVFERRDRRPFIKNIVLGIVGAALCVWGIVALFAVLNGERLKTEGDFDTADSSNSGFAQENAAYFDDAVFIGDSRTEGLMLYGGMPEGTTFYASKGLNVNTAGTTKIQDGGESITIMEGLRRHAFKKVYVMLGVNELGWTS